jgi:hypothetical protein
MRCWIVVSRNMADAAIRAALRRHRSHIMNQDIVHEISHDDVILEFAQDGQHVRDPRSPSPSALGEGFGVRAT